MVLIGDIMKHHGNLDLASYTDAYENPLHPVFDYWDYSCSDRL